MNKRAIMKIMSAVFSKTMMYFPFRERIDKKESRLLAISKIVAIPVNSSINVREL